MYSTVETREAAQGVLDYLTAHPERHNQDSWFGFNENVAEYPAVPGPFIESNVCDTTMCVAGTAIFQAYGVDALVSPRSVLNDTYGGAGAKILGLDSDEADFLFYETNNVEAVDMLRAVANGDQSKFDDLMESIQEGY